MGARLCDEGTEDAKLHAQAALEDLLPVMEAYQGSALENSIELGVAAGRHYRGRTGCILTATAIISVAGACGVVPAIHSVQSGKLARNLQPLLNL